MLFNVLCFYILIQASIIWTTYRFHPFFLICYALFVVWIFYHEFYGKLASYMCDVNRKGRFLKLLCLISCCIDSPKRIKILLQNSSKVLLKKSTHRIKKPKKLQKPLHLEYHILTYKNKFHLQNVKILFVIELQNNFEF